MNKNGERRKGQQIRTVLLSLLRDLCGGKQTLITTGSRGQPSAMHFLS